MRVSNRRIFVPSESCRRTFRIYPACPAPVHVRLRPSRRGGARRIDSRWTEPRTSLDDDSTGRCTPVMHFTANGTAASSFFRRFSGTTCSPQRHAGPSTGRRLRDDRTGSAAARRRRPVPASPRHSLMNYPAPPIATDRPAPSRDRPAACRRTCHDNAALPARRCRVLTRWGRQRRRRQQTTTRFQPRFALGVRQPAVMANLHEALRQDVLHEAAQELRRRQRHRLGPRCDSRSPCSETSRDRRARPPSALLIATRVACRRG